MAEFIHLHNHSHYSLLDAICTIDGLVDAAKEFNMPAVALTDHGVMYGAMEFYNKAKAKGIKPIIGCEAYILTKGSRFDRGSEANSSDIGLREGRSNGQNGSGRAGSKKGGYHHLVLLAKNEQGYRNLMKLVSIGHLEGFYYKPRIDTEVLRQYSDGLVALSACAGGVVSAHLVKGDYNEAKNSAIIYKEIFGEDFYLEIQNHNVDIEKPILEQMPKLAKELGLKLIATNDIHYVKHEHHIPHNLYLYINTDLSKDKEGKNLEHDMRYGTDQIYFKSAEEMCELFRDFPEAVQSTLEVSAKCNLELPQAVYHMPNFPIPENERSPDLDEYLATKAHEGLRKKIKNVTEKELIRLNEELKVIKKMKFSGYFLIVWDFVKYAKENGCLIGPGRGSSAGSLVCYALDITNVNPLDYNLFFERFLNPERVSMPDIDIDFQDDMRDDVIRYSKQKYGENSVSQIATFNRLKTKAVLKDIGRVLNYPFDTINEVTKHVPSVFGRIKSLGDCYEEIPEFRRYFDADHERKKLLEYSMILENLNKNVSVHASGVVIAPSDITNYSPVCRTPQSVPGGENQYMTQYDMKMLEDAGLIKMDFLGLKELKILKHTIDLIEKRKGIKIDLDSLALDDKETFELFSNGQTIGVFQFSKPKMREYLCKLKPKDINDLAAMNALYRPGPMDLIPEFIDKKHGKKGITYLHPKIEGILKDTYGIIVYQEQVMQIVREIAGYSLATADVVRRAMGKKDEKLMKQQEKEFIGGAEKNGVDKKHAKEIFNLIRKFADYGFNKSHSVAYSIVAYYTAYMKTHFPMEFMTTLLNCRKDDMDEMVILINECRRMKIKISSPNINECYADYTIDENQENRIMFGLASIKNVGKGAVDLIVIEREENRPFENFVDFCSRVDTRLVNRKTIESLIYAGAFDIIETNRRKLFDNYEALISKFGNRTSIRESMGQSTLFGGKSNVSVTDVTNAMIYDRPDWSEREKLSFEKSVLGLYLSSNPLTDYEKEINSSSNLRFGDGEDVTSGRIDISKIPTVRMSGIISGLKLKQSKKGNRFCVFTLEDFTGHGECVVFPQTYERYKDILHNEAIVSVSGRAEENGNSIKVIVDGVKAIEAGSGKDAGTRNGEVTKNGIIIKVDSNKFNPDVLNELKNVLNQSFSDEPWNKNIYFDIYKSDTEFKRIKMENVKFNSTVKTAISKIFGEENIAEN